MLEICSSSFLHFHSEVFTSIYALSLKKVRQMLTLVAGHGDNPSPETKHHGDSQVSSTGSQELLRNVYFIIA